MRWLDRAIIMALVIAVGGIAVHGDRGMAQSYHSLTARDVRSIVESAIRDADLASTRDVENAVRTVLNRCRLTGQRLEPGSEADKTEWIADLRC